MCYRNGKMLGEMKASRINQFVSDNRNEKSKVSRCNVFFFRIKNEML